MKNYFCKNLPRPISFVIFFTLLIPLKGDYLNAEYLFEELELIPQLKQKMIAQLFRPILLNL